MSQSDASLVKHRAHAPTDIGAPGLNVPPGGSFETTENSHRVVIAGNDFDTIVASSIVAHNIGVSIDPKFHPSQVSRNRFQYIADRLLPYASTRFVPLEIAAVPQGKTLVVVAALVNPTDNVYRLADLDVTVQAGPPTTTIAQAAVYTAAGQSIVIPARDISFEELELPLSHEPPKIGDRYSLTASFHYGSLQNCERRSCS